LTSGTNNFIDFSGRQTTIPLLAAQDHDLTDDWCPFRWQLMLISVLVLVCFILNQMFWKQCTIRQ